MERDETVRAVFKSVLLRFSVFGLRMGYGMDDTRSWKLRSGSGRAVNDGNEQATASRDSDYATTALEISIYYLFFILFFFFKANLYVCFV